MLKIIAIVCFFLLPVQALSATCSELASQFARDPNAISAEDLSALKRCVDQKLREKHGIQAPPKLPEGAPAPPQGKNLPLPPEGAPAPPQGKQMPNMPAPPQPPQQQ